MSNYEELIAEMESNNLALEALLADIPDGSQVDAATEGLFSKPKTLDEMLENVQKTVDKKCETSEDCDEWLGVVKKEQEKYNEAIKGLKDAAEKFQKDGDQKTLKETCKPILKDLKKTCTLLKMEEVDDDPDEITEDELKLLRDFLVGASDIISKKAEACKDGSCDHEDDDDEKGGDETMECGNTCESFLSMLQGMTPAEEAFEKAKIGFTKVVIALQTKLSNLCESLEKKYNLKKKKAPEGSKAEKRAAYWEQKFRTWKSKLNFKIADNDAKVEKYKEDLEKMKSGIDKDAQDAEKESTTWDTSDFKANSGEEALIDVEIEGATKAVEAALAYCNELTTAMESAKEIVAAESDLDGYTIDSFMEFAMEGIISPDQKQAWNIKGGEISKQMKATIKEAKKAVKAKNYDQAISLYQKALKGYRGLLATAKKIPDKQLGTNIAENDMKYNDGSDTYKGLAKSKAIAWCNKQISACQAAIQKIQDKKSKTAAKASESAMAEAFSDFEATLESLMNDGEKAPVDAEEDPLAGLDEALNED